jgi:homeobox-leucine zipper protein
MTGLDKAMHEMAFFQANFMLQTPHHHDEHHHHHPPPSLNSILPQDYHGKHMPF